ncbi:uncharacterized protein LOC129585394 [Paramacrobiotus metropolitanus]|uniref:uncharacterized protein LOC129585394 n=1 Tax=Paramacrobiotus metropolitanus TaxID=2943436 RepID=UPI002445F0D8|nr:uncharacterized protein LOC129585394 [Paramacrobiotus metropolitanus]XP_055334040.1 uncharacterized protein LOC129585394 [Paramacrobiotus metropolitanus]
MDATVTPNVNDRENGSADLIAKGLLKIKRIRGQSTKKGSSELEKYVEVLAVDTKEDLIKHEAELEELRADPALDIPAATVVSDDEWFSVITSRFADFLEEFYESRLNEPCVLSVPGFFVLAGKEVLEEENSQQTAGIVRDMMILHLGAFLRCLQHTNWHWASLMDDEALRNFFLRDVVPNCLDAQCRVLMARIMLKLFAVAVREGDPTLREQFMALIGQLCRLPDFPVIFMWVFVQFLDYDEIVPYMSGGNCQITYYERDNELSLYEMNIKNLSMPSLLRFRPEPRALRNGGRNGLVTWPRPKKKFKVVTVSPAAALANQTMAVDALWLCCESFPAKEGIPLNPEKSAAQPSSTPNTVQAPDSPPPPQDVSPASPPPDATGLALESPASPDLPEMRNSKNTDEQVSDRFKVEYKDFVMRISVIPDSENSDKKAPRLENVTTYSYLKKRLYSFGGWCWLAACFIDTFEPEEADKVIWWPEFQSVAFFNRNVHIVSAFRKNPVWMKIVDMAAGHPHGFVYFSPIIRPVFISLYIHWETSFESVSSRRNEAALQQTVWLLKCLSKSKMVHEPYCFIGNVVHHLLPNEVSSILSSLWKVIKVYFPNPHRLLSIPEFEQDMRAKQMAETDCLLKIRAVILSHLPAVGVFGKKFFLPARVPLEESRWFESTQSQETTSAPAPINASHLAKVD